MPTYDYRANYRAGLANFVHVMQERWPEDQRAVPIMPAPPKIDYEVIWQLHTAYAQTAAAEARQALLGGGGRRRALKLADLLEAGHRLLDDSARLQVETRRRGVIEKCRLRA